MKTTTRMTALAAMLALALFNCSRQEEAAKPDKGEPAESASVSAAEEEQILLAVKRNLAAAQAKNLDEYLATLDPDSPAYENTRSLMERMFRDYDLHYQLIKLSLEEVQAGTARVEFIQVTRKLSGPEFRDNQVTGRHLLKQTEEGWKIADTELLDVRFFEEGLR